MEDLESKEEAKNAGGEGEVGKTLTQTAIYLEGSGADNGPEGSIVGGGATADTTPKEVDAVGAGGRHGAGKRDRVTCQRKTRQANPPK